MDITTDFRRKMIIKLIEALKESPSFCSISLAQLKEAVLNSEHQTFQQSKSVDEYIYYINEKLKKIRQSAPQRFEFKSDAKLDEGFGEQKHDIPKEPGDSGSIINGNIPPHLKVKQMYSQEQPAPSNAKKKFDIFQNSFDSSKRSLDSIGESVYAEKKAGDNSSGMFQTDISSLGMMKNDFPASCYTPGESIYARNDNSSMQAEKDYFDSKNLFSNSQKAQEGTYRSNYESPRMAKDFVPFANNPDTNLSFKGDYSQARANISGKSPGLRGYPMQDNDPYNMQDQGYLSREYYPGHNEQLASRYRGEFANQQAVLRSGNLSSPGHRNEFNMSQGQRRMEFRREYNRPPHYTMPHTEGMYPGPNGMEYPKMPYSMKSPGMGSEGASLPDMRNEPVPQAFSDKMKKSGGFGRGIQSNIPFNSQMQQPDPHAMRNRESSLGMGREEPGNLDACPSKQYVRNESEMNPSVHSSTNMMYKDGKSMKSGPLPPVEYGYHMGSYPNTPSANKSFVGNVNPSVMESEINKAHGLDAGTDRKLPGNFDAYQRSMFSKSDDPTDFKMGVAQKTEDKKREMMFSTSGKEFLKGKQAGPCDDAAASSGCQDFTKGHYTAPTDESLVSSKRQRPDVPKSPAQSSNVSEIDSFLESNAKLPFEPLRDSLDSDTEIPASLQSFLKRNNLALKEIRDESAWNQLFSEAYRKMERSTITTDRHSEIRDFLCKQREFLSYPFLSEHDIKEYSEYLGKGREKVEYTQLIDKAIQAFAEKRKYNLDFVFNDNEEDEKPNK